MYKPQSNQFPKKQPENQIQIPQNLHFPSQNKIYEALSSLNQFPKLNLEKKLQKDLKTIEANINELSKEVHKLVEQQHENDSDIFSYYKIMDIIKEYLPNSSQKAY